MTDRLAVAAALREIALLLQMKGGSPHRWRAYDKGARALESLERDLMAMTRAGQLTEIPGIGPGLARTITELVETGRSPQLDELRGQLPPGVVELATVLSLPKIQAVHDALGETDAALACLEEAGEQRDAWLAWLDVDPMLDRLRSEPRFQAVRARVMGA